MYFVGYKIVAVAYAHYRVLGFYSKKAAGSGKRHRFVGCSGKATQLSGGVYREVKQVMAWGYSGAGPRLLALYLLCAANVGSVSDFECESYVFDKATLERLREQVDSFHDQVTSKLPDNWEMTTDEIHDWYCTKELPACIKNKSHSPGV